MTPLIPLSREEFRRRRNDLIARGIEPTFENIDPTLREARLRAERLRLMTVAVMVTGAIGAAAIVAMLAMRGG